MFRIQCNFKFNKAYFTSSPVAWNFYKSDEFQYFKKSKVPTFHFQPSLPRLPIPELKKSCERYLRAQQPLRTDEELITLQKLVKDFESHDGIILHKELVEIDSKNKQTSYISAPWFEMYLKDRKPLPINYNPFLVFIDDPKPEYNDPILRSTNLVISSLRFMKSLRNNSLEPEVFHLNPKKSNNSLFRSVTSALPSWLSWYGAYAFKAFPLDMSQYHNLFNTSRIPEKGIDRLSYDPSKRHISVMKDGHIFKVDVLDETGLIYEPKYILGALKWIFESSDNLPAESPVGVLTTLNRDDWADARKYIEKNNTNCSILNDIDNSILHLIYDDEEPTKDYKTLVQRYLHSDGTNRWFDKSISLIIQKNGVAGLNFEHSWGDGVAVLRYFTDIYKDSTENPQVHPDSANDVEPNSHLVQKLEFLLDVKANNLIERAKHSYYKTYSSLGVELFEFLGFGRNLCKTHQISPDSLMQLSFQMAYYLHARKFASTYESCSTAAYKHGRTETMRPCTIETKKFTEAFCSANKHHQDKLLQMLKDCSLVHGNLIKDAVTGQGFDRHFFALNLLAQEKRRVPSLFNHPLHRELNYYIMSTSTLSSDLVMLGAFGPVVPDGLGIGYSIWNDRLGAIVTHSNLVDGQGYTKCLQDALHGLHQILTQQ